MAQNQRPEYDELDPNAQAQRDALVSALDPSASDPFADQGRTETDGYGSGGDPFGGASGAQPESQTPGTDALVQAMGSPSGQSSIYPEGTNLQALGAAPSQSSALPITQTAPNPLNANIQGYLNQTLTSDPYNVTLDDPGVAASSEAYRRSQERSLLKNREAMAERMSAEGTMGGGLDSWVSDAYQSMGDAVAANDANLVLGRQQQKLGQLQSALTTGSGLLTSDQDAAIRMEIARLQNELGQGQLAYQNNAAQLGDDQFYANLLYYLMPQIELRANETAGNLG
jgi:hypothetical protein